MQAVRPVTRPKTLSDVEKEIKIFKSFCGPCDEDWYLIWGITLDREFRRRNENSSADQNDNLCGGTI